MTKGEIRIAAYLASVATGQRTVRQLKRILADRLRLADERGHKNLSRDQIEDLAALESAIQRIERERVKYDRLKNN